MTFKTNKLRDAIAFAILTGVAATAGTGAAFAQQQPQPEQQPQQRAADLDRVTITGTRIAREGFTTPSPVTAVTAEEIRATGAVTIGDLITSMPALTPTYTLGNSTRFIGTAGLGLMDLRGMGTSRTLVLVNGRRHVGATPGSTSVDVNTIPVEWIERVEVITGGASAAYGADAVAGVVNFILKKSFEGMEVRAQTGIAGEGSYGRSFGSVSAGGNFADGRGSAAISVEYSKQDRFGRGNRAIGREFWVQAPNPNYDRNQPSTQDNPQNIFFRPGGNHAFSTGGTFNVGAFTPGNPATYANRYLFNPDGSFRNVRYDGGVMSASQCYDCDFLDLNAVADLEPGFDRSSVNTMFNFDLNDDHRVFLEAKYTKTESNFFGQPSFDSSLRVYRDNPYVTPELGALMDSHGLSVIGVNRFNVDAGRRGEEVERTTSRIVAGVEGFLGEDWSYETSFNYGKTSITRYNLNNRINDRFHAGLDAVRNNDGDIVCRVTIDQNAINPHTGRAYDSIARTGCIPFSIIGDNAINPEAAQWFNTRSTYNGKVEQTVFSASLANDNLFNLPAGAVGFAGGIEYRKEQSQANTDPLSALGLTFLNAIPSSGGSYTVREVFAETSIPLLADLPGVNRLALDLAGRYSDYSTIGSTSTWNIGLDWQIIESLRLRATNAQVVRAPSIGELFSGQSQNFATIADPCNYNPSNSNRPNTAADEALRIANCTALGVPVGWIDSYSANRPGLSGGNPNLEPERARSHSIGFVWQPQFVNGLGVSIDYWRINLNDAIGSVTAQQNATRCVDAPGGINNVFCQAIQRAPVGGLVDGQGREFPAHSISYWTALSENLAQSRRIGVDFEVDYRYQLFGGNVVNRFVGTRLLQSREWAFQDFPEEYREWLTYVADPRYRANFETNFKKNGWDLSWTMRYIHGNLRVAPDSYSTNPGQVSPIRNGAYVYHNAQLAHTFPGSDMRVYLGVNNMFDKNPPLNYFGSDGASAQYDSIGRYMYMGMSYKF